ncbi:MAG: hypothetical protein GTO03_00285, partial [Planctomycetales bacterium]|nr:hypothetical protein [Planctomycetales bacterium]
MNKPVSILLAVVVVTGAAVWLAITGGSWGNADQDQQILGRTAAEGEFSLDILSDAYRLDQVYLSMRGPRSNHAAIPLAPNLPADETLWLTEIETQVVDADTRQPVSNEFFCHSNLTLNPDSTTP